MSGVLSQPRLVHGHRTRSHTSPTYLSWKAMRRRCLEPGHHKYPTYGGAGIKVCDEWRDDFAAFLADMGERPPGKTLDRWPDPDGHYEPDNCRWATPKQQAEWKHPRRAKEARL